MKRFWLLTLALLIFPVLAGAHFMVVEPSAGIVADRAKDTISVSFRFAHPFEHGLMDNDLPLRAGVIVGEKTIDLKKDLVQSKTDGNRIYALKYKIKRPGDHVFFVEPAPYWEPAEQKFIIHYTKAIVHAFGLEQGWDQLVGFPIEIKPLTRPYGLWTGNIFQGQVLLNGKPLPDAEIEVGYSNPQGVKAPEEAFQIQVITTDQNGVFTYAMPKAGWWGFAALADGPEKMKGPDGKPKDVEIGGLIWVEAVDMP